MLTAKPVSMPDGFSEARSRRTCRSCNPPSSSSSFRTKVSGNKTLTALANAFTEGFATPLKSLPKLDKLSAQNLDLIAAVAVNHDCTTASPSKF